jgi:hypothetical protein
MSFRDRFAGPRRESDLTNTEATAETVAQNITAKSLTGSGMTSNKDIPIGFARE